MEELLANVGQLLFWATLNTTLVEAFAKPYKQKYPDADTWWLFYVSVVLGVGLALAVGYNALAATVGDPLVGRLLTGVLIGGGASVIHNVTSKPTEVVLAQVSPEEVLP